MDADFIARAPFSSVFKKRRRRRRRKVKGKKF